MSNSLLYETFLFGNLELIYTRKKAKNIELKKFVEILQNNKDNNLGTFWTWRMYKNFKFLFSIHESNFYSDKELIMTIIDLLDILIKKRYLYHRVIGDINKDKDTIVFLILLREIEERLANYTLINNNIIIKEANQKFKKYFEETLKNHRDIEVMIDYILPYEKNHWSPSWCINLEEENEIIPGIDINIDYYFAYPNIRFNQYMLEDLDLLEKRLKFLSVNANEYFNKAVLPKLNELSKNIFINYPYKTIYENYLTLAKRYKQIYIPSVLKFIDLDKVTNDVWLLAILPRYLSAYLLGFAIISCDVPNEKNITKVIEKILLIGFDKYLENIYKNNADIIKLKSMNIDCGNNNEDDIILDLTYNPVNHYNIDDILIFFNEGLYFIFTYPEFEDLINKERNPYNRNNMPVFAAVLSSVKFKKKVKRQLNYRYLDVDMKSTLADNFSLIKEQINKNIDFDKNITSYNNFTNSLINLFFNNNF